jgi:hypothetical protein
MFAIDATDPSWPDYDLELNVLLTMSGNMAQALNEATAFAIQAMHPTYVGFIGDDNRFRSEGWDEELHKALDEMGGGVAYADDMWHHENLPTAWFVSAKIVEALGWMAMPTLTHLYMDNVWSTIGRGIAHFKYVPSAVIEHLHPTYGKNQWDDSYRRTNSPEMYEHDRLAFEEWLSTKSEEDITTAGLAL